jgi:phenol 2-monooxygenase
VVRVADANPVHLGHHARADGRWRIYAFADAPVPAEATELSAWAAWMIDDAASPVHRFGPEEGPIDRLFDVKVVFRGPYEDVDLPSVPPLFCPRTGPFQLVDHEKIYAVDPSHDVFAERGIGGSGALVVVRPDQYVAHVLPLTARDELTGFFERTMLPRAAAEPLAQT